MVEITIDPSFNDVHHNPRNKKIIIFISILSSIVLLLTSFLLFYFLFLKNYLNQKYLKEVNDGYTNFLDSKDSGKLDKNLIYKKLTYYAVKNDIKIIKGSFERCRAGHCKKLTGNYVHNWKLKNLSEILEGKETIDLDDEFDTIKKNNEFMTRFNIKYPNENGFKPAYVTFRKNKKLIEKHNKNPDRLYTLDYNYFADYAEESMSTTNIPNRKMYKEYQKLSGNMGNPSDQVIHIDWRDKGYVTEVIHQGSCGSCWAIAAADTFSAFKSIKNNAKLTFSYQQVLECSSLDFGCKGGVHRLALEYIKKSQMCTEYQYPYKPVRGKCNSSMCNNPAEFKEIKELTIDTAFEHLKNNGPFITSIRTNNLFMLYGDGIYNGNCKSGTGHSIVVVGHGYDKIKKVNYWIVKNSWGKDWGEDGYVRILDSVDETLGVRTTHCDFLIAAYGLL